MYFDDKASSESLEYRGRKHQLGSTTPALEYVAIHPRFLHNSGQIP